MQLRHHLAETLQPAGNITVEIELVAVIESNPRIGVPEDDTVIAAEVALAGLDPFPGPVAPRCRVIKPLVAKHQEATGVARWHPREIGPAVECVGVAQLAALLRPPCGELLAELGP